MATHDYIISNASGAAVRSDLNNALAAIVSNNSNATEPATTYPYMWWADTTAGQLKLRNAANDGWITIQELDGTMLMEDGAVGTPGLAFASDLDTGFYRPADNELGIATGGTNAVYIDDAQRVGIGTATVDTRFHVSDTDSSSAYSTASILGTQTSIYKQTIHTNQSTGTNEAGIVLRAGESPNIAEYGVSVQRTGATSGDLIFRNRTGASSSSEVVRIDSSGRLLAGTSSSVSAAKIVVQGGATAGNNFGPLLLSRSETSPTANNALGSVSFGDATHSVGAQILGHTDSNWAAGSRPTRLSFWTAPSGSGTPVERMRLSQNGALKVPAAYTLTTGNAANCSVQSDGTFQRSTSSIKYKTNVEDLDTSYTDALLSCRPVWYRSTSESDNPNHSYWGFIAEEVAEIDPRLVFWKTVEITYDENGSAVETPCDPEPEGVAYDRFVPHLLNLIKRQKEQIESQATQLASLEARLTALESA